MNPVQLISWFCIGLLTGIVGGFLVGSAVERALARRSRPKPEMPGSTVRPGEGLPNTWADPGLDSTAHKAALKRDDSLRRMGEGEVLSVEEVQAGMVFPAETRVYKPEDAVFHSDGYPMPVRKAWGDIAYDELGPMFLDQFLLRYFPTLMPESITDACYRDGRSLNPWELFVDQETWAKDMPVLFEQLTGYKLNELQLNNAIAEYVRRLQKADAKKEHAKQQGEEQAANG